MSVRVTLVTLDSLNDEEGVFARREGAYFYISVGALRATFSGLTLGEAVCAWERAEHLHRRLPPH